MYETRREWIQHEDTCHRRVWRCPEHSETLFPVLQDYLCHLSSQHSAEYEAMSTENALQASESISNLADRPCPICKMPLESSKTLQNHIALHLERLALFALPRSAGGESMAGEAESNHANFESDESRDEDFRFEGEQDEERALASRVALRQWHNVLTVVRASVRFYNSAGLKIEQQHNNTTGTVKRTRIPSPNRIGAAADEAKTEEHPDALTSMASLASVYMSQERWEEAETLLVRVMETRIRVLGEDHPDTIAVMNNLASTLSHQGKLDEAEVMMNEVLEKRRHTLGEDHPDTITAMENLANTLSDQDKLGEAGVMKKEVLEKRRVSAADRHLTSSPRPHSSTVTLKFLSAHGSSSASSSVKNFDIRLDNDYIVFRGGEDEAANAQLSGVVVLCLTEPLNISHVDLTLSGILHMSYVKSLHEWMQDGSPPETRADGGQMANHLDLVHVWPTQCLQREELFRAQVDLPRRGEEQVGDADAGQLRMAF